MTNPAQNVAGKKEKHFEQRSTGYVCLRPHSAQYFLLTGPGAALGRRSSLAVALAATGGCSGAGEPE